jgi:hypothetical protein
MHKRLGKLFAYDPHDPTTWTKPVIRLSGYSDAPFLKAERTPVLQAAFDQIVGRGRRGYGTAIATLVSR